jgi:predicted ester cyclase
MAVSSEQERQNREAALRVIEELWNSRNYDVVDDVYDPLVEARAFSEPDGIVGAPAVKDWARKYHDAFSDFHTEPHDVKAKDDRVYGRYHLTGTHDGTLRTARGDIPPTNRTIDTWGLFELRFEDGHCVEEWNSTDIMTMMRQLGVLE